MLLPPFVNYCGQQRAYLGCNISRPGQFPLPGRYSEHHAGPPQYVMFFNPTNSDRRCLNFFFHIMEVAQSHRIAHILFGLRVKDRAHQGQVNKVINYQGNACPTGYTCYL